MKKKELKIQKEKELLSIMLEFPDSRLEIFNKISLDMVSDVHKTIFQDIVSSNELDQIAIWHILEKHSYQYTDDLGLLKSVTREAPNTKLRIMEYFDITDSIRVDEFLDESLKESRWSFHGFDLLGDLKNKIENELSKYSRFEKPKTFDENITDVLERIEKKLSKDTSTKTLSFPSFNTATGGLNEGNLVGIAGAFKNGKTTFGLNLILDIAAQGIPSAIFSLEMSRNELDEKILAFKTGLKYEKLRNPQRLTDEEKRNLMRYSSQIKKSNEKLFIFDKMFSMSEIESTVKKLRQQYGVKLIMLDYLGLVRSSFKNKNVESREREISQLSNSLKILAKESDSIILVLSQLNRSGIKEASSINLAESIGLARDCDFLFTIYKPELNGYNRIKMEGKEVQISENDFVVKLDSSRHTQSGKEFLLELSENGKMKEIETRFDNSYLAALRESIEI